LSIGRPTSRFIPGPKFHIASSWNVKWIQGMQMYGVRGDQLRAARAMLGLRLQDIQRATGGAVVKGTLCRLEGSGAASLIRIIRFAPKATGWSAPPGMGLLANSPAEWSFALAEYFDDASANTYLRCQVRGRAKGAETVSMKFNRLFTETKRSYTRPPHFRYFASQEVSTADSLLNAQR
jgi:hypothetical protein